jgi:L-asparaginase
VSLETALWRVAGRGMRVVRVSRCAYGGVVGNSETQLPAMPALGAAQARIELMLELLAAVP